MTLGLIVTTVGRPEALTVLLESVAAQAAAVDEIIIVDQSGGDRVKEVARQYDSKLDIQYRAAERRGAGFGRNIGLRMAESDVVGFPDDDCYYGPQSLRFLRRTIGSVIGAYDGVSIGLDPVSLIRASLANSFYVVNRWQAPPAPRLFVRTEVAREVGGFPEDIGPGTEGRYPAGEDIEFSLQLIRGGAKLLAGRDLLEGTDISCSATEDQLDEAEAYGRSICYVIARNGGTAADVLIECFSKAVLCTRMVSKSDWQKLAYQAKQLKGLVLEGFRGS